MAVKSAAGKAKQTGFRQRQLDNAGAGCIDSAAFIAFGNYGLRFFPDLATASDEAC